MYLSHLCADGSLDMYLSHLCADGSLDMYLSHLRADGSLDMYLSHLCADGSSLGRGQLGKAAQMALASSALGSLLQRRRAPGGRVQLLLPAMAEVTHYGIFSYKTVSHNA